MNHLNEETLEYIAATGETSQIEALHLSNCIHCKALLEEFKAFDTMLEDSFRMNEQHIDIKQSILNILVPEKNSKDYMNSILGSLFLISIITVFYFFPLQLEIFKTSFSDLIKVSFIQTNSNSILLSTLAILIGFVLDRVVQKFRNTNLT